MTLHWLLVIAGCAGIGIGAVLHIIFDNRRRRKQFTSQPIDVSRLRSQLRETPLRRAREAHKPSPQGREIPKAPDGTKPRRPPRSGSNVRKPP